MALLHSFAYHASEQAFKAIAVADPTCAMAHWGVAMSYYHQLWSPPDPVDLRKGLAETGQAGLLGGKTPRERQFIAAAAAYYRDSVCASSEGSGKGSTFIARLPLIRAASVVNFQ